MRLIDADKLKKSMERMMCTGKEPDEESYTYDVVCCVIDEAPSVDAEPVRHGRWIFGEYDFIGYPVKCSECGLEVPHVNRDVWMKYDGHKYCGICGAKMDAKEEQQ